jgi:hypothetical protein
MSLSHKIIGNGSSMPGSGERRPVALTRAEIAPVQGYLAVVDEAGPKLYVHIREAHGKIQAQAAAAAAEQARQLQWRQVASADLAALAAQQARDALQAPSAAQLQVDDRIARADLAREAAERARNRV